MESLIEFFKNPAGAASLVAILVAVNVILSGVSKLLEIIKDKTESQVDNKAFEIIGKVSSFMQKAVDWMQGNRKH
jgi:hypothetical protein